MRKTILLCCITIACVNADDFKTSNKLDALYVKECGSCHMAYQPELLNKNSWLQMMDTLQDHFKTDASLEREDVEKIKEYLLKNSTNTMKNPKNVIAISQMPWFLKEHRKLPSQTIQHEKIKTISNCVACHTKAQYGDFEENTLKIPGLIRKYKD